MKILFASLLAASVLSASAPQTEVIDYRFDQVRRTVTVTTPDKQLPAQAGSVARSGDRVQTGWFSYALIASERHRAKFEIFSSTQVQLAAGEPGVILSLERGRLRAMFDKITGSEPRIVKTPGALLAVRGTQYDVEVDNDGRTSLSVIEGVVEVRSALREQPMLVRAGEGCVYSPREAPMPRQGGRGMMDPRGRDDGDHGRPDGDDHGHGRGPGMMPPGGSGQPTPPPPNPPRMHP